MKTQTNVRALAAKIVYQVLEQGHSLSTLHPELQTSLSPKDKGLLAELYYGVLRTLPQEEFIVQRLMKCPFSGKNRILHYLVLIGLYQLIHMRIPAHAAVSETVEGASTLQKSGLKNVVNGVLRQFQRKQNALLSKFAEQGNTSLHPDWLRQRITEAYPKNWATIFEANNQKAPMWLRVNPTYYSATEYRDILLSEGIVAKCDDTLPQAIRLQEPTAVHALPGFKKGWVTVQDRAAQYAGILLTPQDGEIILDMCAAPGGKTTHILELAPKAAVLAVDSDPKRITRIHDNLQRLKQNATVITGDGRFPEVWAQGKQFDRILLDAPCSATGVIRRHPDIKWLRQDSDIAPLTQLQQDILMAIWPYLKPGGTLVYATCSILPEENQRQIERFLSKTLDASLSQDIIQCLPDQMGGDGFFYAVLKKAAT